jgi:hypothetical protein
LFEFFIFKEVDQNGPHLRDHFGVIWMDIKIHSCVVIDNVSQDIYFCIIEKNKNKTFTFK